MEEELLKSKKLESVGILAGGIAHDFNNILTAVLGNLSLARERIADHEVKKTLEAAEEATTQAKNLTQQLLAFSRGGAPIKEAASVKELLPETVAFVLRGSNVEPVFHLPPDLWPVEVDKAQISQVINNLVINAKQAMPAGGVIEVSAKNLVLGPDEISGLSAGKYITMSIKDTGEGIPKENLAKIFDPYFTTKPGGSGLGLTTTYYILQRHGGHISVESDVGVGSTFYVYLPASKTPAAGRKKGLPKLFFGKGNILVMDDEEVIRKAAESMLNYLGYKVELVQNGWLALDVFRRAAKDGKPFDAVVMDLTVPGGMGGKEAITQLLEIDSKVKVIVSSGYSDDPIMSEYQKHGFRGVLVKPYKLEDLSRAIHELLKNGGK
jgi:CheY-like chemotaxis protein